METLPNTPETMDDCLAACKGADDNCEDDCTSGGFICCDGRCANTDNDILPDSDTGIYFAGGAAIGSTLFAGQQGTRSILLPHSPLRPTVPQCSGPGAVLGKRVGKRYSGDE